MAVGVHAVAKSRIANVMFHATEPRVIGVLDWELSTLGHPLADFSYHCMSWHIPPGHFRGIAGLDLAKVGLDALTVSLSHPDAQVALLSGASEITAHFSSPPFQYQQLEKPGIRTVLSSYDVLGGPATTGKASPTATSPAVAATIGRLIVLVPTISTTYTEPYNLSRQVQSLDWFRVPIRYYDLMAFRPDPPTGLATVLLLIRSRTATFRQINANLLQISEQLKRMHPIGPAQSGPAQKPV